MRDIAPPFTRASLIAAAGRIGRQLGSQRLAGFKGVPLPCIAWRRGTETVPATTLTDTSSPTPGSPSERAEPSATTIPVLVLLADYLAAGFDTRQLANGYNTAANALEQIQTLTILVVGALLVMNTDGFTVGMLVAFQMFSGRLSQPVLKLVGLYQELQQARIAVLRLGDILNMPREPYSLVPARAQPAGQGGARIELQDVGFRYDENQPWLYRHMTLNVPAGKAIAIMGPSGCGKSTLAKLLQGFHLAQEGRILIDGADLRHLSANELRGHFGVVPQETILFSGTLYDNLIAAHPHARFEDVVTACRMAEIHDFIESLPQGYQTEVGERGVGLSGGQRQRIAIARALLKRPRVLIFDEATSALDGTTAEQFARTINGLKGAVTLLFIAHQLPKGLHVDGIVKIAPRPTVVTQEPLAQEAP